MKKKKKKDKDAYAESIYFYSSEWVITFTFVKGFLIA